MTWMARTVLVPLGLVIFVAAILVVAEAWGPHPKCDRQFPKIVGCALGSYENLADGLIGAGGALLAAWIAWNLIRRQVEEQRRTAQIADRTFWQTQRNEAEVALSGLEIVRRVIATCLDEFDTLHTQDPHPHVEALRRIQPSGVLDQSQWPPTGRQLVSWDVNILIARLRNLYLRHTSAANDSRLAETETELADLANQMRGLMARIIAATAECRQDRDRANQTLAELDDVEANDPAI